MKIGIAGPISTESISKHLRGSTSSLPPGYEGAPLLGTLIDLLIERGHTIAAFTTSPGLPLSPYDSVVADGERFRIYYCPVRPHAFRPKQGRMGRAFDCFRMEREALRRTMLLEHPDLIHAHWTYEFAIAAIESRLPHIITCHDAPQIVLRYMPDLYRLIRYFMSKRALRQAAFLTAVSPYLRKALCGYARVPIVDIPNPLPNDAPLPLCDNIRIDPIRPRIAMVLNGWGRLKNPKPALLAFADLKRKIPGAEMSLFGIDYGPSEKASQWLQKRGLHAGIHCIGRLSHESLLKRLAAHHILVHPSLLESCPMGIAEAMMLGLPAVGGNNSGGVPWVIGNGGLVTNVRSHRAIMSSLEYLISNPQRHMEYSRRAILQACTLFSNTHVIEQYENIYRSIIRQSYDIQKNGKASVAKDHSH